MLRFTLFNPTNYSVYVRCCHTISQRCLSTDQSKATVPAPVGSGLSTAKVADNLPMIYTPSLFSRIKMKLGFQAELREPQMVLFQAAAISYYMIGSSVNYDEIQRELNMPDVFASFGRVVFLHVWFLLVRYVQLGKINREILHRPAMMIIIELSHVGRCISS
jgi:hypothetical protein